MTMIGLTELGRELISRARDIGRPRDGRLCSFGEANPDRTFYLISFRSGAPLFEAFHHAMLSIRVACVSGMEPAVDTARYPKVRGMEWRELFEPISDTELDEVWASARVLLASTAMPVGVCDLLAPESFDDTDRIETHRELIERWIRPSRRVCELAEAESARASMRGRCVAVICSNRESGTETLAQPMPDLLLRRTVDIIARGTADFCYLMGEEASARAMFEAELGDLLMSRLEMDEAEPIRSLVETIAASRCDALVSGLHHQSVAALEMNGKRYKEYNIIDLGYIK